MSNFSTFSKSFALQADTTKKKVSYFYDPDVGSYYYGSGHPMKPQRIRMAHSLILSYNLYRQMDVYHPHIASINELTKFHDYDYVDFLSSIGVENYLLFSNKLLKYNIGEGNDCPLFDNLLEFQASCAGASIDAAIQLNHKTCDIAINWSGGLHHAKRSEASGFCYINDIVLAILELLKYHVRVLYIDIDIHHGDGVEEAFYLCHRVMTVSFHKYGDFFPGTGDIKDIGAGSGKYYSVNVPLNSGMNDELFVPLYKDIISKCIEIYKPGVIVLQCGADSIVGDRLGCFNLSTKGHGACVEWTKSLGLPLLILGGGGYTIKNVARAWLYETAITLGCHNVINEKIPPNEYYQYFGPNYQLHLEPDASLSNLNTSSFCNIIREQVYDHLNRLDQVPCADYYIIPPDLRDISASVKYDDDDLAKIEWDGGGLAYNVIQELPHKLRRMNYKNDFDDYDDRDQSAFFNKLKIEGADTEIISNGEESDNFY